MFNCIKEEITGSKFEIRNETQHSITIIPYSDGNLSYKDSVRVEKNQIITIDGGWERGLTPGILYATFVKDGPILVIFDKIFKIIHYRDDLNTHSEKYYSLTSSRNFYNELSYKKTMTDINKFNRNVLLIYTFTEQDYLDAQ
jgi:hypothetical protein